LNEFSEMLKDKFLKLDLGQEGFLVKFGGYESKLVGFGEYLGSVRGEILDFMERVNLQKVDDLELMTKNFNKTVELEVTLEKERRSMLEVRDLAEQQRGLVTEVKQTLANEIKGNLDSTVKKDEFELFVRKTDKDVGFVSGNLDILSKDYHQKLNNKCDLAEVQQALNQMQKKLNVFLLQMKSDIIDDISQKTSSQLVNFMSNQRKSPIPSPNMANQGSNSIFSPYTNQNLSAQNPNLQMQDFEGSIHQQHHDGSSQGTNFDRGSYTQSHNNASYTINPNGNEPKASGSGNVGNFGSNSGKFVGSAGTKPLDYEMISEVLDTKLNIEDFDNFLTLNKNSINELQMTVMEKVNEKDFLEYLSTKPDIEKVNLWLSSVSEQIERCVPLPTYQQDLSNQESVNESLCSENIIGRWTWKSGTFGAAHEPQQDDFNSNSNSNYENQKPLPVPWENQVINTFRENFCWSAGVNYIQIVTGGYYLFQVCVSPKKPDTKVRVQIMINNEVVWYGNALKSNFGIDLLDNYQENLDRASDDDAETDQDEFWMEYERYAATNMRGVSISELFLLTNNCQVAVVCDGSSVCEAMMSIKRFC
jgi:hypothetical protein